MFGVLTGMTDRHYYNFAVIISGGSRKLIRNGDTVEFLWCWKWFDASSHIHYVFEVKIERKIHTVL